MRYSSIALYFFFCLLFVLPLSFSANLTLDLVEGGCAGYKNTQLGLFYDNGTMIDSSNFEITLYNGPIKGLGELDSFTANQAPYKIEFEKHNNYFYDIETNNDTLYSGLEGSILIYNCESNNNLDEEVNWIENEFQFNSLLIINYYSNSTQNIDFMIDTLEEVDNEANYGENEEVEYYRITYDETKEIRNISIISENSISILETNRNEWQSFENKFKNISLPSTLAIKTELQREENNSVINTTNTQDSNSVNTSSNTQMNSNQNENIDSQSSIEKNNENNVVMYLIIGGGVLFIIIVIVVMKSISRSKKNKKVLDEAPLTLTQTKIMTYCDNYKHRYEPKEIVEQLVEQGYDREVVINTLWKYVEKEKQD